MTKKNLTEAVAEQLQIEKEQRKHFKAHCVHLAISLHGDTPTYSIASILGNADEIYDYCTKE